ncbi:MAG: hypothetical protein JWO31_43, partial [Phycisphaerales bacterium]|nr:hypothetical protein [Phycisphaerales bacterium]
MFSIRNRPSARRGTVAARTPVRPFARLRAAALFALAAGLA